MYSSITLNILKTLMAQYSTCSPLKWSPNFNDIDSKSNLVHENALQRCLYDFRLEKLYNTCRQQQQASMYTYDPCTHVMLRLPMTIHNK